MRLIHRINTGLAYDLQDKMTCEICCDDRFVTYDSGEVDDFGYFLIDCTEFRYG